MTGLRSTHWLIQFNLIVWLSTVAFIAAQQKGGYLLCIGLVGVGIAVVLEHMYYRRVYKPWTDRQQNDVKPA